MQNKISGGISSSPYETAAVSMVVDDPRLIDWLLQTQFTNGSWGGRIYFAADRLLQTMMVVRALLDYQRRCGEQDDIKDSASNGILYIIKALETWHDDALRAADLSGYELLVPTHHRMLVAAGIDLPPLPTTIVTRNQRKLAMLPPNAFYHPRLSNLHHSMEALEGTIAPSDGARMEAVLLANGSLASSPSATAFLIRQPGVSDAARRRMYTYIDAARNIDGGYSPTAPLDLVVELWRLYFERMIAAPDLLRARLLWLISPLQLDNGVGANALFVPDGDDTAVAALLAADFGLEYEATKLAGALMRDFYVDSGHFRTYQLEMTASPSTTAHAAEALATLLRHRLGSPAEQDQWLQALTCLGEYLLQHLWAVDKWHVSRYYTLLKLVNSLSAMAALSDQFPQLSAIAQQWASSRDSIRQRLFHIQDRSGGWGDWDMPTIEETAYAILTLLQMPSDDPQWQQALIRSRDFLNSSGERGFAEMWIDKTLYQPEAIIISAVQAAQGLLHQTLGAVNPNIATLKRPPAKKY